MLLETVAGAMEGVDRLWGKEVLVVVGCCI